MSRLTVKGQNFKGALFYRNIEYKFSLNHQETGRYVMRGCISAISPETGRVMTETIDGNAQKVTAEVCCNETSESAAKTAIQNAVVKLYRKHVRTIHRELMNTPRPETMIPSVAAALYAKTCVAKIHSKAKDSTAEKYVKEITTFYDLLPDKPMAKISETMILEALKSQKVGKTKAARLRDFWQYLVDAGHIAGINPFPVLEKRTPSAASKHRVVERVDELTPDQQDKLFQIIMDKKTIYGGDCGVALYVWGGFTAKDAKTWGDLKIRDAEASFVIMTHRRDDLSGATHTFDRPLFPQAAEILIRMKNQLLEKYSETKLQKMPIIGMQKNPAKPMETQNLFQYAGKLLREVGIKEATFAKLKKTEKESAAKRIMTNTYKKNLYLRIGLTWDDGALQYLQGLSLNGNVTNDNYTSYSDEEAAARLFTAMMAIRPQTELNEDGQIVEDSGPVKSITALPRHTRERVGIHGTIMLPPGAEIRIRCLHGVTGQICARGLLPDGKKKRASGKRKNGE